MTLSRNGNAESARTVQGELKVALSNRKSSSCPISSRNVTRNGGHCAVSEQSVADQVHGISWPGVPWRPPPTPSNASHTPQITPPPPTQHHLKVNTHSPSKICTEHVGSRTWELVNSKRIHLSRQREPIKARQHMAMLTGGGGWGEEGGCLFAAGLVLLDACVCVCVVVEEWWWGGSASHVDGIDGDGLEVIDSPRWQRLAAKQPRVHRPLHDRHRSTGAPSTSHTLFNFR